MSSIFHWGKKTYLAFSLEYFDSRHDNWDRICLYFFYRKLNLFLFCFVKNLLELIQYSSRDVGGNPESILTSPCHYSDLFVMTGDFGSDHALEK